jgi:hypothetical protein
MNKFKESIDNSSAVLLKKYFLTSISWQDILNFLYEQSLIKNEDLEVKKDPNALVDVFGNILTMQPFWFAPQTGKVWEDFVELKDFLIKLNKDFDVDPKFEECSFYQHWDDRPCNCNSIWHSEGIKVSLSNKYIFEHSDPWHACYLQILGESFWKINGEKSVTYKLEEGDLLFFPKNTSHEVWSEGPRAGMLISADKKRIFNF